MGFNICPDGGPPRLWRFVPPGVLPANMLCDLDHRQNLLIIDKQKFDELGWLEQHRMLRTDGSMEYVAANRKESSDLTRIFS